MREGLGVLDLVSGVTPYVHTAFRIWCQGQPPPHTQTHTHARTHTHTHTGADPDEDPPSKSEQLARRTYINANYVHGFDGQPHTYIATQVHIAIVCVYQCTFVRMCLHACGIFLGVYGVRGDAHIP